MSSTVNQIQDLTQQEYKWGFVTQVDEDRLPPGLNEDIIRAIAMKKGEPDFMLEWRLKAYRYWAEIEQKHEEPTWANVKYPPIDYQALSYYSAPKQKKELKSLEEVDPEILNTYTKLGIPLHEQKLLAGVAVDAVFDSVSVATTFKAKLAALQAGFPADPAQTLRQVSILFLDAVGSTALGANLDPEEISTVMDGLLRASVAWLREAPPLGVSPLMLALAPE